MSAGQEPRTGKTKSQEFVRSHTSDTLRAGKGRERRRREVVFKVCGEKPEGGEAQEGIGRVVA
jgi:hypothetical protein